MVIIVGVVRLLGHLLEVLVVVVEVVVCSGSSNSWGIEFIEILVETSSSSSSSSSSSRWRYMVVVSDDRR